MTKNPFINAVAAIAYIFFVASIMFYGTANVGPDDSVMAPIAIISLFTLSAAVMGYLFLYEPLLLLLDGKKKIALQLFLKSVMIFGVMTFIILGLFFSGIIN